MRLNKQSPFTLSCVKKRRFPSLSFFHHTCIAGSARTGDGVRRSLNLLRGRTFAYSISHQCCYLWHGAGPTTSLWPTFVRDNQQHPSLRRIHRTIRMISRHCITLGKAIYDPRADARARCKSSRPEAVITSRLAAIRWGPHLRKSALHIL